MASSKSILPADYTPWLVSLKSRIISAQQRATLAVNQELVLIYHYLGIYSSANANFARMAINTFVKDCSSNNPSIRSLAARNLANLRFKGRD